MAIDNSFISRHPKARLMACLLLLVVGFNMASIATSARLGNLHFFGNSTPAEMRIERLMSENGLARTPQMGWNSWNHFHCNIDEKLIKETADAMVSSGLAAVGYMYINLAAVSAAGSAPNWSIRSTGFSQAFWGLCEGATARCCWNKLK
ncbi:Glycoside hydrolase, family 27 [Dillenia turbinata]|uniref:Alpha-galactosidase n=1 Tax=Dillenia turbinata TaxID=194707 RepID=A0AAN8VB92_9MAGN